METNKFGIFGLALLVLGGCSHFADVSHPAQLRQKLGYDEMMSGDTADTAPIPNKYFMPAEDSADALHVFSWKVTIPELAMQTVPAEIEPKTIHGKTTQLFPGVTLEFFSDGATWCQLCAISFNQRTAGAFGRFKWSLERCGPNLATRACPVHRFHSC